MPKDYRIKSIYDLLQVPADRRPQCLRELQHALDLMEFVGIPPTDVAFTWTDDGDVSVTIPDQGGKAFLTLHVEQTQ